MVALYTPTGYLSTFFFGLAQNCHQKAEHHRRGDAARRGGQAAGDDAQQALLPYRLRHALGQLVAKACQRHGGARPGPVHQRLIQSHRL